MLKTFIDALEAAERQLAQEAPYDPSEAISAAEAAQWAECLPDLLTAGSAQQRKALMRKLINIAEALAEAHVAEQKSRDEIQERIVSVRQQQAGARRALDRYFAAFELPQTVWKAKDSCESRSSLNNPPLGITTSPGTRRLRKCESPLIHRSPPRQAKPSL